METMSIPMEAIFVPERQREADNKKVSELAQSIEQIGLLQPIGVIDGRSMGDELGERPFQLVFGLHRLQAMQLLERREIDAHLLPPDLTEEEYRLIELQENSARNDLTRAQRKAFAAEIGRLNEKLTQLGNRENFTESWLVEITQRLGVTKHTLYNWWNAFCRELGVHLTPRQALEPHRQRFFDWLEDQQRQAEEEKARKADEMRLCLQHTSCANAVDHLADLVESYGYAVVEAEVLTVFYATYRPQEVATGA